MATEYFGSSSVTAPREQAVAPIVDEGDRLSYIDHLGVYVPGGIALEIGLVLAEKPNDYRLATLIAVGATALTAKFSQYLDGPSKR